MFVSEEEKNYTTDCTKSFLYDGRISDGVIDRFIEFVRSNKPEYVNLATGNLFRDYKDIKKVIEGVQDLFEVNYQRGIPRCLKIHLLLIIDSIDEKVISILQDLGCSTIIYTRENNNNVQELKMLFESNVLFKLGNKPMPFVDNWTCKNCLLYNQQYSNWSDSIGFHADGTVRFFYESLPAIHSVELANIHQDEEITYELMIEREQRLHNYLRKRELLHDDRNYMCMNVCSRFKVTKDGIMRDGKIVEAF